MLHSPTHILSRTDKQLSNSNKKYNESNDGRKLERHDSLLFTSHNWMDTTESLLYRHTPHRCTVHTLSTLRAHTHTHTSKDIQWISPSNPHSSQLACPKKIWKFCDDQMTLVLPGSLGQACINIHTHSNQCQGASLKPNLHSLVSLTHTVLHIHTLTSPPSLPYWPTRQQLVCVKH